MHSPAWPSPLPALALGVIGAGTPHRGPWCPLQRGPKCTPGCWGGKAAGGRHGGLGRRVVTVPLRHCCSLVDVPHPRAANPGAHLSPPCLHQGWPPPFRTLNWRPFVNTGLNRFCRVRNPDRDPQPNLAPRLWGARVPKSSRFLILLVSHFPKCHLVGLVAPLHHARPQEPARTGHLPSQGCSVLPPPPKPHL